MKRAPGWLGLICSGSNWEQVELWLEAAARHGFTDVQPALQWAGWGPDDLKRLRETIDQLGLRCVALGVYSAIHPADRPIDAAFATTKRELQVAIQGARALGTQQVVVWAGTLGPFMGHHAENHTPETRLAFDAAIKELQPALREHGVRLLIEPWLDHILANESVTAEVCAGDPEHLGVVIDCANFIEPPQWPERNRRIEQIMAALSDYVGIVHLKDMTVTGDGSFDLPMFGRGGLTEPLAAALAPLRGKVPIIAEHLPSEEAIPELLTAIERWFPS